MLVSTLERQFVLYCSYYQAHISEKEAWFLVALFEALNILPLIGH